jgi:uncharacterized protein YndB with AHSA1/START domain
VREAAAEIEATAVVPATPEEVFEFLSDLSNHWRLVDRFVEVVSVDGDSGVVRLRGPLGVRRTVRTHVLQTDRPRALEGVAELSGGTRARVSWALSPEHGATRVRLTAEVLSASRPDRLLLALGGRAWMRKRLAFGLERLASATLPRSQRRAAGIAPPSPSRPDPAYRSAGGSS